MLSWRPTRRDEVETAWARQKPAMSLLAIRMIRTALDFVGLSLRRRAAVFVDADGDPDDAAADEDEWDVLLKGLRKRCCWVRLLAVVADAAADRDPSARCLLQDWRATSDSGSRTETARVDDQMPRMKIEPEGRRKAMTARRIMR